MKKGKGPIGRFVTLFHQSRRVKVMPIMMSPGQIRHSYDNRCKHQSAEANTRAEGFR